MGCGSSHTASAIKAAPATLTWNSDNIGGRIPKKNGNPQNHKFNGYDFGLRVRVRGNKQSTFVATSKGNGDKVTIKESHLKHLPEKYAIIEVMIMAKFYHSPYIPRLREVFVEDKVSIFMVLDYVDPSRLNQFVDISHKTTTLSPEDARHIVKSIVGALIYCHELDVIVRGLTAENIMVKKNSSPNELGSFFDVKITDFSQAVARGSLENLADHPLFEWNAVPYMPPEAILGHPYSTSLDLWSLGVLTFLMLSGELPFEHEDDRILVNSIRYASYSFNHNNKWNSVNEHAKYFIGRLLVADPESRPSAKESASEHWITVE